MSDLTASADDIIAALNLKPHPEGGWYAETFRDTEIIGGRPSSTAIFFLLRKGERSHWHRVDAVEIWHYYAGAPMLLSIFDKNDSVELTLGADISAGQTPQGVVPKDAWQEAATLGEWTLVGCTVAPGFQFSGFELAPPDFNPRISERL